MPWSSSVTLKTANRWATATAVGLLSALCLATAPTAKAGDTCDNAELRAQSNSSALPDCRAYEMVSSPYKEGFPVSPKRFTDDGIVSYQSTGSFAGASHGSPGNQYHAVRSSAGWLTTSEDPSAAAYTSGIEGGITGAVSIESADLRLSLWRMFRQGEPETEVSFWLRGPGDVLTRVGHAFPTGGALNTDLLSVRGASNDLSHIVVSSGLSGTNVGTALREYVGTGNSSPPRAVSIYNNGQPTPGETCISDVSDDGRVIVFASGCHDTDPEQFEQLWARVDGSTTIMISGSECTRSSGDQGGACNSVSPAEYAGAAADGSRVFFTTSQQLVNDDVDQGNDLYACDIPAAAPAPVGTANRCEQLTQVSGTSSSAEVQDAVAVSDDGARVYFVAQGTPLAHNLGVNGAAAVAGQANLYMWRKDAANSGQVSFIAKLDTNDLSRAQMTPDGRYLVVTTASGLVTSGPSADSYGARDVYRYDAATHTMLRLSVSVAGGGGDGLGFDASTVAASAVTADGSTVVFNSAESLSTNDTNGVTDVYVWHDGQVSAISARGGEAVGVTPSGRDILFTTSSPILSADRDVIGDIYTAHVDGGFKAERAASCSGDECQGVVSDPPSLSAPQPPGISDAHDVVGMVSLRTLTAGQRRRFSATGRVALAVRANISGLVRARAEANVGGRVVTVGLGRRRMTGPGLAAVHLKLSRRARRQLAARGRLTVNISIIHSRAAKARRMTVALTRAREKTSSVGSRS